MRASTETPLNVLGDALSKRDGASVSRSIAAAAATRRASGAFLAHRQEMLSLLAANRMDEALELLRSFRALGGTIDDRLASSLLFACRRNAAPATVESIFSLCLADAAAVLNNPRSAKFGYIDAAALCENYMVALAAATRTTMRAIHTAVGDAARAAAAATTAAAAAAAAAADGAPATAAAAATAAQSASAAAAAVAAQRAAHERAAQFALAEAERVVGAVWPTRVGAAPSSALFGAAMAVAAAAGGRRSSTSTSGSSGSAGAAAVAFWNRHVEGGVVPPVGAYGHLLDVLCDGGDVRAVCDVVAEVAARASAGDGAPAVGVVVPRVLRLLAASALPRLARGSGYVAGGSGGSARTHSARTHTPAVGVGVGGVGSVGGAGVGAGSPGGAAGAALLALSRLLAGVAEEVEAAAACGRAPQAAPVAVIDAVYALLVAERARPTGCSCRGRK